METDKRLSFKLAKALSIKVHIAILRVMKEQGIFYDSTYNLIEEIIAKTLGEVELKNDCGLCERYKRNYARPHCDLCELQEAMGGFSCYHQDSLFKKTVKGKYKKRIEAEKQLLEMLKSLEDKNPDL